ncbi:MAG: RagB/SusD family nutrient uptake outer membrane protein [Adhaeribacter sp.]
MKKIFIYGLLLAAMPLWSGCEEYLTEDDPLNITDDGWWDAPSNGLTALLTVYDGQINGNNPYGATNNQGQFMVLSDEAVMRLDGGWEEFVKGSHTANWGKSLSFWQFKYQHIRRANRFLEFSDRIFLDDSTKNQQRYEARALRALFHLELMQVYGGVPIVDKVVLPNENELARNTEAEVAKFVRDELTACAENLPTATQYATDYGRLSSGACWAYLSRLGLHIKDYALARDAAKKVIDSREYRLHRSTNANGNHFSELFSYAGEINRERIVVTINGSSASWTNFVPQGAGGTSVTYVSPTAAIVNAFETKQGKTLAELGTDSARIYAANPNYKNNRDPRLAVSVLAPKELLPVTTTYRPDPFNQAVNNVDRIGLQKSTATGFWIRKYVDVRDRNSTRNLDFMNFRYAEVLLNYVEALVELGQWNHPDVFTHLNDIRTRAKMPVVDVARYNSQEKMRELVRRERQVELAFEGRRYFDIRRWGIAEQVMNGTVYGAVDPATGEPVEVESRSYIPAKDRFWPIPLREINANPNMTQNEGY